MVFLSTTLTLMIRLHDHILKFINVLNIHFWETIAMIIYIGSSCCPFTVYYYQPFHFQDFIMT